MSSQSKLSFVRIVVDDMHRAEQFYTSTFGLRRTAMTDADDGLEVVLQGDGDMSLALYHWKDRRAFALGSAQQIGFVVDDVDMVYERAIAAGAQPAQPPTDYHGSVRAAFVNDPDGHNIELIRWG